jgi:hypothetical protein
MSENKKLPVLLFLDDYRNPIEKKEWLVFSPIEQPYELVWILDYDGFTKHIQERGLPDAICFDHDLSDFQAFKANYPELMEDVPWPETEKTGMDCAKWLVEYCMDNKKPLPLYNIQSANPVGKENIDKYLKNFLKHQP